MRVQSNHASKDGGFYHDYADKKPAYIPARRPSPPVSVDFESMIVETMAKCEPINPLANQLGVVVESLESLWVVRGIGQWLVPMRDGENKIIGIHLRCDDGSKKAVLGSRNGLFIPQVEPQKVAFICEGMSNTAALLTMGYYAIGRPSCNSGADMLKVALKRLGVHRIVVVADADEIKVNGARPGQDGAKKLKKELGLMSVIYTAPNPLKDVRQLLNKYGQDTAKMIIDDSIASKIWTKV